jgi:hypothetical protein
MVQFLDPETDVMVQFLAPEIVIIGERNYILHHTHIFISDEIGDHLSQQDFERVPKAKPNIANT